MATHPTVLKLPLLDHTSITIAIAGTISLEVPLPLVYLTAIGLQTLCARKVCMCNIYAYCGLLIT